MDAIDELLTRGVDKIYPSTDVLEKALRSGKKLKLYQGFDPTGTQLHIGHMTGLMKLRQFQNLGHHVIFLIGDFTGMIGDPSGKSDARKPLSKKQVRSNAKTYKKQTSKILNYTGSNPVEVKYNSDWLSKISTIEFLNIAGYMTWAQIRERDMFQERLKQGKDLFVNEFIYPLLQGYDSVYMDVDLEIGGSDQLFNMMTGRDLMHKMKRKEKFVMTTPLLTDSSGKKIGKTEGNVIALTAVPAQFYGMIMSLPDDIIVKSFEYITDVPMGQVNTIRKEIAGGKNPMIYKKQLAYYLTQMLNDSKQADDAQSFFEKTVQKHENPDSITEYSISGKQTLMDILVSVASIASNSQAKRLIAEKAVELDGKIMTDPKEIVYPGILKVGKRKFIKLIN